MTGIEGVTIVVEHLIPKVPTYIAQCCREWIMPMTGHPGRCGICDERPTFLRDDTA